mgnify:CR=1
MACYAPGVAHLVGQMQSNCLHGVILWYNGTMSKVKSGPPLSFSRSGGKPLSCYTEANGRASVHILT